jgi:hypothetical protein
MAPYDNNKPITLTATSIVTTPRLGIHIHSFAPSSPVLRAWMANDLLAMQRFVSMGIDVERGHSEVTASPLGFKKVVDMVVLNYASENYPKTDYVTHPLLIRLSAAAALLFHVLRRPEWQYSPEYLELLKHADSLLSQAQEEANRPGVDNTEFLRVLDWPDFYHRVGRKNLEFAGDEVRRAWILELRYRARGAGAPPMGRKL